MKRDWPMPITEENFPQCWDYMDKLYRSARIKVLTAKIGGFLSNLLFLFLLLVGANGVILTYFSGSYCDFLQKMNFFLTPWETLYGLLKLGDSMAADVGKLLLFAFLASALLFLLLFALILLLYHPRRKECPSGRFGETAPQLAKLTQEVHAASFKTHITSSVVSIILVIIAAFVLFFAYSFYLQDAAKISSLLSRFPTSDAATNALLYVLFGYILGHFLCLPLLLATRPLYYVRFPYTLLVQAETSSLYAEEPIDGMTEEAIAQRRRDNAAPIREEAIRTEEKAGHRIAKELFFKAALGGDVAAMEHYARHCLLDHQKDPARYWLDKAASTEEMSPEGKNMRLRLKMGWNHNLEYLREGQDFSLKAKRRRSVLHMVKNVLSLVLFLGISAAAVVAAIRYFGADEASLMADLKAMFADVSENIIADSSTIPVEEVLPFETPQLTLTEAGTPWEGACAAYDDSGAPVVFCYGQDFGGNLLVPCGFGEEETLRTAGVYTGNVWDIRDISKHVTYDSFTRTTVVAEEYLMGLEPGEYFFILNGGARYIPVLVSETTTFNSTQRGLAASGNDIGWIVSNLENPQDITLPFYNLGDNTIRSLSQLIRSDFSADPLVNAVEEQFYTISPDGRSVTVHAEFWQQQEVGSYIDFQVRLANGDKLDTGYVHVGTVQGSFTGLLEILGDGTYSLSRSSDYTASYEFGLPGSPQYLSVHTDSGETLLEENLSSLTSEYIDFDAQTITIPEELLKSHLAAGEGFQIGISYLTSHNQSAYRNFRVEATW